LIWILRTAARAERKRDSAYGAQSNGGESRHGCCHRCRECSLNRWLERTRNGDGNRTVST
jgi:endogenous inhibitor of DNA gyrase (YacG/DUF329 family)